MIGAETIGDLLQQAERYLRTGNIDSTNVRLDAEILLCHVMSFDRSKIYSHPEKTIADAKRKVFNKLISKRYQGMPVAYLIEKKEFYSIELKINQHTFIPRPDTEYLVETALKFIPESKPLRIVDLGTGSGAIALAIAKARPACLLTATDISFSALTVAKENAKILGLNNVRFIQSNWYDNLLRECFDMIISNPPYIRENDPHLRGDGVCFEPFMALEAGNDGMQAIRKIVRHAEMHILDSGRLLLECGYDQGHQVSSIFRKHNFRDVKTVKDIVGRERIVYGKRP